MLYDRVWSRALNDFRRKLKKRSSVPLSQFHNASLKHKINQHGVAKWRPSD